ncbi:hypothetical protein CDAR_396591 [Caerostris darwini]|uniref:Uncharacterized protein n=1 Tax=Caerostris darwini TaxID=1538125 RepID=A0AAV4PMH6_9ARAC|nr:hypothetical protein CDAR_396591 [Caerostris darwini]
MVCSLAQRSDTRPGFNFMSGLAPWRIINRIYSTLSKGRWSVGGSMWGFHYGMIWNRCAPEGPGGSVNAKSLLWWANSGDDTV